MHPQDVELLFSCAWFAFWIFFAVINLNNAINERARDIAQREIRRHEKNQHRKRKAVKQAPAATQLQPQPVVVAAARPAKPPSPVIVLHQMQLIVGQGLDPNDWLAQEPDFDLHLGETGSIGG